MTRNRTLIKRLFYFLVPSLHRRVVQGIKRLWALGVLGLIVPSQDATELEIEA